MTTSLVWLRNDLRVGDNPALAAAVGRSGPVTALYIEESDPALRPRGAASRWWLHKSLEALGRDLARIGVRLEFRRGAAEKTVLAAAAEHQATALFWNRRYGPAEREVDAAVKARARREGLEVESFAAHLLVEPWELTTGVGKPYSVYTPFWNALRSRDIAPPRPLPAGRDPIAWQGLGTGYVPPAWAGKLERHCAVGEAEARRKLADFLDGLVTDYPEGRDFPARAATSGLSPHLAFGEISARQVWHAARAAAHRTPPAAGSIGKFLSELGWRDFNYSQLYHREDIARAPMVEKFGDLSWRDDPAAFDAWSRGETGIPIVDAGMSELWETGIMHNRVRMLVASLLAKNLLLDWRKGEAWFWDTLVDADPANNPGNWQWVAGCGLDASPFFRIFNPVTQGEKFDPQGDYVRRWVPELRALPDSLVHRPWEGGGVGGYPEPIVDLKESRERALQAFKAL